MPNWLKRVLVAAVLLPSILYVVFGLAALPFCLFILTVSLLGLREVLAMLRRLKFRPFAASAFVFSILLLASAYSPIRFAGPDSSFLVIAAFAFFLLLAQLARGPNRGGFPDMAVTLFAVLYVAGLLSFAIRLRLAEDGARWVFFLLSTTWLFDTLAYVFGKTLGRKKLMPAVSPKKTWIGLWGGALSTVVVAGALCHLPDFGLPRITPVFGSDMALAGLVLIICVIGQLGDLAESALKRAAGLKDSGSLLPGHGGMLDKLDSFTLTAPLVYAVAVLL